MLFFGVVRGGSRRWIDLGFFNLQPSEFAKATLALVLAKFFGESRRGGAHATTTCSSPARSPRCRCCIIARQPDLGTAVTLLPVLFVVAFVGRHADAVSSASLALVGVLAAPVAWKFALQDYQKERISTFLDPTQDARGAGYQQIQARITVGSGGLWGKGFMKGTQGQLRFLPVAHNDFIFSVLAEEQGFVGVLVALGLVSVRDYARARGGPAGQGPARRVPGAGRAGELHVPGDLQHHHVGGPGAGQGADAAAHELRRLVHDRDAGGVRPHPQRADAPVYELTVGVEISQLRVLWMTLCARPVTLTMRQLRQLRAARSPLGVTGMNKEMIISSNAHETRVAILEDDQVAEIFIEREHKRGVVGNVYKGRVSKVLPGMQSAFVDLGLERDGFLYVSDVIATVRGVRPPRDRRGRRRRRRRRASRRRPTARRPATRPRAAEAARPRPRPSRPRRARSGPEPKIEELLKEGQEVIVQVAKEPLGTKGARLTSHVTLPGRFLVFMPTVDHIGVSRKIDSRDERSRLRGIVREFREQHGFTGGVIIRTAAAGRPKEDIVSRPAATSTRSGPRCGRSRRRSARRRSSTSEQSLVAKLLRDLLTDDYSAIRIDNAQEHQRVARVHRAHHAGARAAVKLYDKDFPIFEEYGVQAEIDKALRSKVWLKSGGSIVINQTEALVAIDVNTGRYVGKKTAGRLEDTILKTNLEAVKEIVRQIRLRDLGGIIVLDFIDMEEKKNRQKVFQAVEQELRKDRAPSKALQVSDFGLVIITRKRVKQSLERVLTEPCPYCAGQRGRSSRARRSATRSCPR